MKVQLNPYMRDCLVYRATLRDLARTKDPEQREYLQGALEQLAEVIGVEQAHAITDLEIQNGAAGVLARCLGATGRGNRC